MDGATGPGLLLVAHGSRDPRFPATAQRVCAAVSARLPGAQVDLSYLDLNEPLVGDAIGAARTDLVMVPLLFAEGYHSRIDLPAIVNERRQPGRRVTQTPVIGNLPLVSALSDRLNEAGLRADDGVILCAVGSSDPSAGHHVRRRAIELSTHLHRPVEVVFATKLGAGEQNLRSAVHRLRSAGATRVVLSPYFLSAGLLTERVESALDRWAPGSLVAGPLGAHHAIVDAAVSMYQKHSRRRNDIVSADIHAA